MRSLTPIACCVALLGVIGLSRPAAAQTSTTEDIINLTFTGVPSPIANAYIGLYSSNGPADAFDGYAPLQNIPAGNSAQTFVYGPTSDSVTQPAGLSGISPEFYAITGVYTNSSVDGVVPGLTIGISASEAAKLEGQSYTSAFPSTAPPESELIAELESNPGPGILDPALEAYINSFNAQVVPAVVSTDGGTATLLNFSNGVSAGTAEATIGTQIVTTGPVTTSGVPLPPAAWSSLLLLSGLAGISALRRKFSF